MKKIPTLFVRDPENNYRTLTREVHPECEWVLSGEGTATRKYDGQCVMVDEAGRWWKRREVKRGRPEPEMFECVQEDPSTGNRVGWVPVTILPSDKYLLEAFYNVTNPNDIDPGTYEAVGPKIQGHPEGLEEHRLIAHADAEVIDDCPRDYDGLMAWLPSFPGEGVVWHHPDGRMAKIKKRDVGR